jgi:hypothetical protein
MQIHFKDKTHNQLEENKMKKRSLFAAVAMLVISAVLLTSATYAWFAEAGNATVGTFSGNVAAAGTGVQVQSHVSGAKWTNALTKTDLASSEDLYASEYVPCSTTDGATWKKTSIGSGNTYSAFSGATAGTDYDQYVFNVGTLAAGDTVTGTLYVGGTAGAAARVLVEKKVGAGNWTQVGYYSPAAETWNGIVNFGALTVVDDGDYYVTAADITAALSTANATDYLIPMTSTAAPASGGVAIDLGEVGVAGSATYTQIRVTTWVEGNDMDCLARTVAGNSITTNWSFVAATPTPTP